jgi:hypothetical protein
MVICLAMAAPLWDRETFHGRRELKFSEPWLGAHIRTGAIGADVQ